MRYLNHRLYIPALIILLMAVLSGCGGSPSAVQKETVVNPQVSSNLKTPAQGTSAQLDAETVNKLIEAINDEYKARALYQAVIAKHGSVRPFANIIQSENVHIDELKTLFNTYGVAVPDDQYAGKIQAPATFNESCRVGAEAEIDNAAMYDRLLKNVKEPDIAAAFTTLRDASRNNHLPAFQRAGGN